MIYIHIYNIYIYIHIQTYTYIYIHIYIKTYIHTYMYIVYFTAFRYSLKHLYLKDHLTYRFIRPKYNNLPLFLP